MISNFSYFPIRNAQYASERCNSTFLLFCLGGGQVLQPPAPWSWRRIFLFAGVYGPLAFRGHQQTSSSVNYFWGLFSDQATILYQYYFICGDKGRACKRGSLSFDREGSWGNAWAGRYANLPPPFYSAANCLRPEIERSGGAVVRGLSTSVRQNTFFEGRL